MIVRIARKELVDLGRDERFRWSAALVATLLLAALLVGWRNWRDVRAQHEQAQAEARRHFDDQDEKSPHAAAHYGLYVFKPKLPLAFVDPGVDPYTGISVFLEAHRQNDFRNRPARDGTTLQRFGELTAAAVLQVLMPLLIIFLAFPAIAAEREQGTLRQVLSLGVRPAALVGGKALALVVLLAATAAPAVAVGAWALGRTGPGAAEAWPRAAAMGLGYAAYLGIFLAASLLVSARARSSRAALVVLLGFWIVNVMVAPRLSADLARRLYPTPSALAFAATIERDIRQGIDGHDPQDVRLERLKAELLAKYDVEDVEELPVNFQGVALQAGEDYGNAVFERHYAALWDTFARQDRVRQALGLLAPTLAIRELSMGLAGTDNRQFRAFAEAAEAHRRELVRSLNRDLEVNGADLGFMYQAGPDLWKSLPRFAYEAPGLAETLGRQAPAVAALALWLALGTALVVRAARNLRAD